MANKILGAARGRFLDVFRGSYIREPEQRAAFMQLFVLTSAYSPDIQMELV